MLVLEINEFKEIRVTYKDITIFCDKFRIIKNRIFLYKNDEFISTFEFSDLDFKQGE